MAAREHDEDPAVLARRLAGRPRSAVPGQTGPPAVTPLAIARLAGNRAVGRLLAAGPRPDQAARQAAGQAADQAADQAAGAAAGRARPVVQRKFGFEFQSTRNAFVPGGGAAGVGEKERVYQDKDGFFRVEGDNATPAEADLEFVTEATENVVEALAAVSGASLLARTLAGHAQWDVRPGAAPLGGTWLRPARIRIADPHFAATPQATIGIPIDRLTTLLRNVLLVPKAKQDTIGYAAVDRMIKQETLDAVDKRTAVWSGTSQLSPAVRGLLEMVALYIEQGSREVDPVSKPTDTSVEIDKKWWELGTADGPKASFDLMARTSFRAAFNSLDNTDKDVFRGLMAPKAAAAAVGVPSVLGVQLKMTDSFPRTPYLADADVVRGNDFLLDSFQIRKVLNGKKQAVYVVTRAPTVQQWLASICADVPGHDRAGRDLMSPPIGWGKRDPQLEAQHPFPQSAEIRARHLYGMGAYPMDQRARPDRDPEQLFIAEIRGFSASLRHYDMDTNPPADKWLDATQIALNHHFAGLLTENEASFWASIKDQPQLVQGIGAFRFALSSLYDIWKQQHTV